MELVNQIYPRYPNLPEKISRYIILTTTAVTTSIKQIVNDGQNNFSRSSQAKYEKLTELINWLMWVMVMKSMLIKKNICDIIFIGPRFL